MTSDYVTNELAKAIYTVNRHAKSAPEPRQLYELKKATIDKLITQNKVKKIGLHFSPNPRKSLQHSTLLVQIGDYYFHTFPTKQDFVELEHLGEVDLHYRNPKTHMSLKLARNLLYDYLGWEQPSIQPKKSSYYTPSSLGQWNGHRKRHYKQNRSKTNK